MGRFDTLGKLVSAHRAWRPTPRGGGVSGGRQWAGGGPPRLVCDPPRPVCDHLNDASSYFHHLALNKGNVCVKFVAKYHLDKSVLMGTSEISGYKGWLPRAKLRPLVEIKLARPIRGQDFR